MPTERHVACFMDSWMRALVLAVSLGAGLSAVGISLEWIPPPLRKVAAMAGGMAALHLGMTAHYYAPLMSPAAFPTDLLEPTPARKGWAEVKVQELPPDATLVYWPGAEPGAMPFQKALEWGAQACGVARTDCEGSATLSLPPAVASGGQALVHYRTVEGPGGLSEVRTVRMQG